MQRFNNFSLKQYNTFNIDVKAKEFIQFDEPKEIRNWIEEGEFNNPFLILGGGSNLLFTRDYDGSVLYPAFKGKKIVNENDDYAFVYFAAGEDWDQCVEWAVEHNLWGVENLSLIPGHAGAAPVQNIGAYGVELSDLVETVEGVYLETGKKFLKKKDSCSYGYRYSIFKGPLRNKVIVTGVTLRLNKKPATKLGYGSLKVEVENMGAITLQNIRKAVINIRTSKLPDPEEKGNGGSFFKNPVISGNFYKNLQDKWPEIPGYFLNESNRVKVPAGWLIDKAGWKGYKSGRAGVHDKQALVLVNNGGASGLEIADLAMKIKEDIIQKFEILLETEVNIL
ncbi:UDP-N-acetylmuramate dehydrogenase [Marinilabilia rubra]|uniref:UDP-N-acetylenolpyruvoylglucosamine reductase n=1 Tax=Marinilabilia rubra TaxID=2162893 RepID=A0A2U2BAE4_9BACT|nr:UDP-N-acetylmuramate dehydrogenase [Marinilabilia rubra]PWE00039.1 UDP-N-acetylmuramate dehydrogenase [Marinilabilia rubra]